MACPMAYPMAYLYILKRTQFLSRKCRKLCVSDDVIRKIVTSAKKNYAKWWLLWRSLLIQSFIAIAHSYQKLYRGGGRNPPPHPRKVQKSPSWIGLIDRSFLYIFLIKKFHRNIVFFAHESIYHWRGNYIVLILVKILLKKISYFGCY